MRSRPSLWHPAVLLLVVTTLVAGRPASSGSADGVDRPTGGASAAAKEPKYDLRYKFKTDEEIRCNVLHQASVRTTMDGTSQTVATVSQSIKVWKILDVDAHGHFTFVHSVEHVKMRNEVTGREGVHYDSETDTKAPPGFEDISRRVGVPLAVVTLDVRGNVVKRDERVPPAPGQSTQMTMPLPDHAVTVGESWTFPADVRVKLHSGDFKLIRARQRYTLDAVAQGVASIKVQTQILSPVHDPEIESQLIECAAAGTMRFDIDAGRVIGQQIDLDQSVVGYPNEKSSMHYRTRFTEELLDSAERTAERPHTAAPKK